MALAVLRQEARQPSDGLPQIILVRQEHNAEVLMIGVIEARSLHQQFQIKNSKTLALVGLGFSTFSRLFTLFILFLMNRTDNVLNHTLQLFAPTLISHSIFILVTFKFLFRFDNWTLKNPDAERHHERNFHLDEELI